MYLATAGLLDINATFFIELAAFVLMMLLLGKFAWPPIRKAATERQQFVAEQIESAESSRTAAEDRLARAEAQLQDARRQADEVLKAAERSGDALRGELKTRGEEEARRMVESARREIEAAREQAIQQVRAEVADLVVEATAKVIGQTLDSAQHRRLIDDAIRDVSASRAN